MRHKETELQKAAVRVADITRAVERSKEALVICLEDHEQKWLAYQEAKRNLDDTQTLLRAQQEKRDRELGTVQQMLFQDANKGRILCAVNEERPF
jgi:hypothetical protein